MATTVDGVLYFDATSASLQDQEGIGYRKVIDCRQVRLCEAPVSNDVFRLYTAPAETDLYLMNIHEAAAFLLELRVGRFFPESPIPLN